MRRDWLSTHVAAAVAAPLMLGLQLSEVTASTPAPTAATTLAQATMPGSAVPGSAETSADSSNTTTTEAATTTATGGGETASSPAGIDSSTPESTSLDEGIPPASGEDGGSFVPRGDDELPSELDVENNPYLKANSTGLSESGRTAGDQEYGAFLPPTDTSASEIPGNEAGVEMINILGLDVYNRRVNITTPPDTDVAEVVRLLAERANLNFVYGQGVIKGKVTLNLRDVPLGVALQSLLSTQDLAIVREGENVMRIAPRKEVRPGAVDSRTVYIKLNWVTASALETTLKTVAGTGGSVKAHKETNTLIITHSAPNVALLRDLVAQLDVPEKQVMIEARMVELLIQNGRQLGSETFMERRDSSNNSQTLGVLSSNAAKTVTRRVITLDPATGRPIITEVTDNIAARAVDSLRSSLLTAGAPRFSFGGVVSIFGKEFDVATALDGLETKNIVNTLANPRVITLNNQEAEIDIQREVPYLEAQQGSSQGVISATVKFKDAGIRLVVLPAITNNGYVRMRLTPEQRIQSGLFPNPTTLSDIPIIDRRTAVTNVIVKDEDTVVLGGLRQIETVDLKTGLPWISEAPIIGWFFKRDNKAHRKNDLMLFVTPHIVKAPVLAPAENYKYSRVDAHWDLPDFFFDDSVDQRESRHRFEADMNPRDYYPQNLQLPPPVSVEQNMAVEETGATQTETVETVTEEAAKPN